METLCKKCKKPKGDTDTSCKCGRPTKFRKIYIKKVDKYLETRQDSQVQVLKQVNDAKGHEMFETKTKVQLPTIEGFALFINVVGTQSLYDWEKVHPKFLHALNKIRLEQYKRLVDKGLSGEYNSTIAKLMLSSNHGMREKVDSDITSGGKPIIEWEK